MQLYSIHTGNFKLDGGAMFGVVPKSLWQRINPADENNMCNWAMRCLLVQEGNRLILIDNGIGDKQDEKFFGYYYLNGDNSLDSSLAKHGFHRDDITDVFLTHLHFDHCGGSIRWNKNRTAYEPAFPNAKFWTNQTHWDHAMKPNARERASFLRENLEPMQDSGQLNFVSGSNFIPGFDILISNGHTTGLMMPKITVGDRTIVYVSDMIPSSGHVPVPYVMAYDIRPLDTMDEKAKFLNEAAANNYVLMFEHDLKVECATVIQTERGVKLDRTFDLSELG